MVRRQRLALFLAFTLGIGACVDHVVGPSPDVPVAAAYPKVASRFTVVTATASDSRVPTITPVADSIVVTMVVPTICGRDTVMAGAARDSLIVTLRRTLLPLPCAILLPDVRVNAVAAVSASHHIVVSVQTLDFQDTTRALVATSVLGVPQLSNRN
jgi:hypothetical protein